MARGETYEQFTEKFKPKKTTDDCYTPPAVYDAVADWVAAEYGTPRASFVRPFYPGGDYEHYDYPADCVVVDNPPFSILNKILRFYNARGIRFFLFAPALTLFNSRTAGDFQFLACGAAITYENGATVSTSFVTNLEPGGFRTAPDLRRLIEVANDTQTRSLPKYTYPDNIASAATIGKLSKHDIDFRVSSRHYTFILRLDAQQDRGKQIFGGGLLLSEKAAAEKAAAEKAAAEKAAAEKSHVWELSDREKEIIKSLA